MGQRDEPRVVDGRDEHFCGETDERRHLLVLERASVRAKTVVLNEDDNQIRDDLEKQFLLVRPEMRQSPDPSERITGNTPNSS